MRVDYLQSLSQIIQHDNFIYDIFGIGIDNKPIYSYDIHRYVDKAKKGCVVFHTLTKFQEFVPKYESLEAAFQAASEILEISDVEAEFLFISGNHTAFMNFNANKYESFYSEVQAKLRYLINNGQKSTI